jgi:hypothetical protein
MIVYMFHILLEVDANRCLNKARLPYQDYESLRELHPEVMKTMINIEEWQCDKCYLLFFWEWYMRIHGHM